MADNNISLEEMKKCELEMLTFIHEVCIKNNLRYFLAYGTLIGAVRHKGFIPWDDDIDIVMPRKDFVKLCELFPKETYYSLVSSYTTDGYTVPFAKVFDKRTRLIQNYNFVEAVDIGVYIDIFILDGFPTSSSVARDHAKRIERLMNRWYWANTKFRVSNSIVHDTIRYICTIPYRIKGAEYYSRLLEETLSKYDYDDSYLVTDASSMDPLAKCTVLKDIYGNGVLVDFEDKHFWAPEKYDEYLRINYGDYLQLPPQKERVSNHNYKAFWIEQ